jgi:uncharacterized protein YndB with AHSA1/START domain
MKLFELTKSRTIAAPPEAVFDVWMDPKSPGGPWFDCERVIINPVEDGLFYHVVESKNELWAHYGRFIAIARPRRIQHTWVSKATRGLESLVTIDLEARDGKTEFILRHSGLPDDEMGHLHDGGWDWILSDFSASFAPDAATAERAST